MLAWLTDSFTLLWVHTLLCLSFLWLDTDNWTTPTCANLSAVPSRSHMWASSQSTVLKGACLMSCWMMTSPSTGASGGKSPPAGVSDDIPVFLVLLCLVRLCFQIDPILDMGYKCKTAPPLADYPLPLTLLGGCHTCISTRCFMGDFTPETVSLMTVGCVRSQVKTPIII